MELDPILRVAVGALLAVPIGLDRELRGKPAGLRTHVAVAAASAALGTVSILSAQGDQSSDVTRIAAQVASGVGFMGAGVIFAARGHVHGLTTAAALWSAAAIGLCVGLDQTMVGVALAVVLVIVLGPLDWISHRLISERKPHLRQFRFIVADLDTLVQAQDVLARDDVEIRSMRVQPFGDDQIVARVEMRSRNDVAEPLFSELTDLPGLRFLSPTALTPTP